LLLGAIKKIGFGLGAVPALTHIKQQIDSILVRNFPMGKKHKNPKANSRTSLSLSQVEELHIQAN
jgi:hypothetical protein